MSETDNKMRLYRNLASPYTRRVRAVIEELGLGEQIEEIDVDPYNPPAEFLKINPLSKVPVLITEQGEALPDSNLIMSYLFTRGHGLAALPSGARRWGALRRQYLAEGIIDAAVASTNEKRRPEGIIYQVFLDRQIVAMRRAIDQLDAEAAELSPETPTTVEITVGCALGYLDFRMPYIEWRKNHDALAAWYAQFSERPSMQKTAPQAA
ncbi:glutathione S-transferase family protein [Solimonas variicoloris]|uniref:glutathione S-transferase family protein n=1 Tax=Solimonas variicoloris TaxID=254408 RepID=UPI00035CC6B1|nr:glutathione S-transferase family protein [Solimonas variicoloris]